MLRNALRNAVLVRLGVVGLLLLAGHRAEARTEPFKVTGGGPAPLGLSVLGAESPHRATGGATFLGRYHGNGIANVLTFDPNTGSGTFRGTYTFVSANGDRLACTYGDTRNGARHDGTFQVYDAGGGNITVVFIAEFNPVPAQCTGRFRHVTGGSFLMVAVTDPFPLQINSDGFTPPFKYSWAGEGTLQFGQGAD
jgi:hypothetical protein